MANTLLTPSIIAKEMLMQLENNLLMANLVHREYKNEFVKVGDDISIRRPVKFRSKSGATLVKQNVQEGSVTLKINGREHVGWEFNTQDLTLTIEDFSERYIKPASITLANKVDRDMHSLYADVHNLVGTPGTPPANFLNIAAASERMDNLAMPDDGRRYGLLTPNVGYKIADDVKQRFISDINRTALESGFIDKIATLESFKTQNIARHTVGVGTGTPTVNGADQNVTYLATKDSGEQNLITTAWTASTTGILKKGDVFTIVGVNAVNPVDGTDLGYLQEFVVKADANSGVAGATTVIISPPIILADTDDNAPYQTCTAAPANGALITLKSGTGGATFPQNLAFHRNAFALVTVPLEMPDGVAFKARETHNGLSIRVIKDYDIVNDVDIIRCDILYGTKTIDDRLAVRLTS